MMDNLISSQVIKQQMIKYGFTAPDMTVTEFVEDCLPSAQQWVPVTERLPIKEFEEGRKNGTVYDLYPCLVTRYSTHTDKPRTRTYVCKSYFDGEDFMLHGGYAPNEESDTENTLAWLPLPEPYATTQSNDSNTLDALGEETQHGKEEAMG